MFRSIATALLLLALPAGAAPAADWSDIEGRIQYAWFTEDLRGLRAVLGNLPRGDADDALRAYYQGFGQYRIALLTQARDRDAARRAAEACADRLGQSIEARRDFADAIALHAACLRLVAALKPWKLPLLGPRSSAQFERAVALAPDNPRVLLLGAAAGDGPARAIATLGKAIAAFEAERQGVASLPAWGAPEAYLELARREFERGDATAARAALERALLLAPQFEAAKRLLASLTAN
ncbi:MAG: hypothetical protein CMLOHMNK_00208 [Steroidobacteraceae bacterium]|nr:hypothetical protein [Steroidobacteraceae bacterium]